MPLLEQQISLLQQIYSWRTPYLDPFFRFLNYFDTEYFFIFLIPLIWFGFSWRWGLRIFYLLIFSSFVNAYCKDLFALPRPDPHFALILLNSYGFPSGAAQTSLLLGSLLIHYGKKNWLWALGLSYILLISFSRLYLGVHYPLDLIGGWTIGLILFLLYLYLCPRIEAFFSKRSPLFALAASVGIPLLFIALYPHPKIIYLMSSMIAVGIGMLLSLHYKLYLKEPHGILHRLLPTAIAIAGAFLCYAVLQSREMLQMPSLFHLILQASTLGLWISLAASPLCKALINNSVRK